MLIKSIDVGSREFSCWNAFGEEDIEFVECSALGFWKSEVCPDEDDPCTASPDESSVSFEIPGILEDLLAMIHQFRRFRVPDSS